MNRFLLIAFILESVSFEACIQSNTEQPAQADLLPVVDSNGDTIHAVAKTDTEWKKELTPLEFNVLREKGTERAFTGKYNKFKKQGVYTCKACSLTLFSSDAKFNSGTGWPSFFEPIDETHILEETDASHGMKRTEVLCRRCGGHLGHVFADGPRPTGLRYCMNSASLSFEPSEDTLKGQD